MNSLGQIAIIGGGCFGTFYARQLTEARRRDRVAFRDLLIVDQNPDCQARTALPQDPSLNFIVESWEPFLDRWLRSDDREYEGPPQAGDDAIVPSPMMPHLMAGGLLRWARARWPERAIELRAVEREVGTPWESSGSDGTKYLSFADWLCPVHCIEPAICPVIRAPRSWELNERLVAFSQDCGYHDVVSFFCRHWAFGVGMYFRSEVTAGRERVAELGGQGPARIMVATVSRCHGAVGELFLGPLGPVESGNE